MGGASAADPPPADCQNIDTQTGTCRVEVVIPPTTGGDTQPVKNKPKKQECRDSIKDVVVPCSSEWGSWSSARNCYLQPMSPPPPVGSPEWGGHTTGGVYNCYGPDGPTGVEAPFWLPQAPAVVIDPAELAQQALAQMNLKAIAIGIVPEPQAGRVGLVGMPTWMWARNPGATTVGPITKTAAAGGVVVTATAKVDRIVWRMGDGHTVTCDGPGTPYADSYGRQASPDCGYTYATTGKYTVAATSYWVVEWAGGGQAGQIPLNLTDDVGPIVVGEAQVISQ